MVHMDSPAMVGFFFLTITAKPELREKAFTID